MPYGSGLSAQLGYAAESTWGTAVTVTKFAEFNTESIDRQVTWLESEGLKAGQAYKRVNRVKQSRFTVAGSFDIEAPDKGLGLLLKHAMGSSISAPTQIASSTAYRQTHTPGSKANLGLTIQVGRPQTDGTVQPFTYYGCKIGSWSFSVSDGELAKFSFEVDGKEMTTATALATASYVTGTGNFSFAETATATGGVFTIGGTASTASGRMSISGGSTPTTMIKSFTLNFNTPMATERYGLGNAGTKGQAIENGTPTITCELGGEFSSRSEFYDLLTNNTTTALQLDLAHGDAGSSNPYRLSFIMPALKMKEGSVNVGGPDILEQSINLEAYDDQTNAPLQVEIVSTDTTL